MVTAALLLNYRNVQVCHFVQQGTVTFTEHNTFVLLKKSTGEKNKNTSRDLEASI